MHVQNFSWYQGTVFLPGEKKVVEEKSKLQCGQAMFELCVVFDFSIDRIRVDVSRCDEGDSPAEADVTVLLLNHLNDKHLKCTAGVRKFATKFAVQLVFCDGATPAQLSSLQQKGFLKEDTLTFDWKVSVRRDALMKNLTNEIQASDVFSANFGAMLASGNFSDVTIVVEGQQIAAHSQILAPQSQVFAAILSHDMQERRSKQVQIEELSADTVRRMLTFIYRGRLDENLEQAEDSTLALMEAAHRFAVSSLVNHCVQSLCSSLSIQNVAERLVKADLLGIEPFKVSCVNFITATDEHLCAVQRTDSFKVMSRKQPHLFVDILAAAFPAEPLAKASRTEALEPIS